MSRERAPWVRRCPKGHATLESRSTRDYYLCRSCEAYYTGTPVDIRDVDGFPRPEAEYEVVRHQQQRGECA